MGIEIISELIPKNKASFALADVNNLRGGYVQVGTLQEMSNILNYSDRLKEGMICYVREANDKEHMYLLINSKWELWEGQGGSGSGGGNGVVVVPTEHYLNTSPELCVKGQIVFIEDIGQLRFYNGVVWESFSRLYIQDTPPSDPNGIWIDISEDKEHLESSTIIQSLLKVIYILQQKVNKMEYAFNNVMDFGDFQNNNYHLFNDAPGVEPLYGTSEEDDLEQQKANLNVLLGDSPEPVEYKEFSANCRHLSVKSGKLIDMQKNKNDFAPSELLYCYDTRTLWIKDPKTFKLVQIGKVGGDINPDIPEEIMEGIIEQGKKIAGIKFVDMVNPNKSYLFEINNGEIDLYDEDLDTINLPDPNNQVKNSNSDDYKTAYEPKPSNSDPSKLNPKFYINMVYCGGNSNNSDSYNPCNYNFIELSNTTDYDINLKGIYLHYTEGVANPDGTRYWITLPLKGTIKAKNTFLVRGAKCGLDKYALVKVGKPDMYWSVSNTVQSDLLDTEEHHVFDDRGFIKLDNNCSIYLSGETKDGKYTDKNKALTISNPYITKSGFLGLLYGYIDLIGFGLAGDLSMPSENVAMAEASPDRIMMKYYSMDELAQAYKSMKKRDNSKDWTYIDLVNTNQEIKLDDYIPKNAFLHKNIFFNKHLIADGIPCFVNVTFGYDAHKTRCFAWVSKGYRDEFLLYKKEGDKDWITVESFKAGDGRDGKGRNWDSEIYNRIRSFTTDGTYFTTHKCIIDLPPCETFLKYIYRVGSEGRWTSEKSFTLRNRHEVIKNGFNFLHITDLQGFNQEEYKTWELSAEFIEKKDPEEYDFIINTGDFTQSGNRINEWIDYFNGGLCLTNYLEQMGTVGNNDLCPVNPLILGDGRNLAKHNPINMNYFFTFEHPHSIPRSSSGIYIPSTYDFIYGDTYFLSINSEITTTAVTELYNLGEENIYEVTLKNWCIQQLTYLDESIKWKVAFCHEAPFTIITNAVIENFIKGTETKRGGSHLNSVGNYFFSKFLQDNEFSLCLCGHKHTYACSRYLREPSNPDENTFAIDIYDPNGANADWYLGLKTSGKDYTKLVNISDDTSKWYVKYVMCQATGYKLTSNKELPGDHLPFLLEYYKADNIASPPKPNPNLQFPHYIIWNIGKGQETELEYLWNYSTNQVDIPLNPTLKEARDRILGHAKKVWNKKNESVEQSANWNYKYNAPLTVNDVDYYGGNGESLNNGRNNIIVEKLWQK